MSEDRKGRPPTHDWPALRKKWEGGTSVTSVTDFAAQNGVSRKALSNRMNADAKAGKPWLSPKIVPESSSNVVDLNGRRGKGKREGASQRNVTADVDFAESGNALMSQADFRRLLATSGDPLEDSTRRAQIAMAAAEGLLIRVIAGTVVPGINQSLADVVDKAVAVMERATKLGRLNAGKKDGDKSVDGDGDAEDNKWQIERRIVGEPEAAAS